MRKLLPLAVAVIAAAVLVVPASAMRIAYRPPAQRALLAEVVVAGTVTGFEKDLVQAPSSPGAKDSVGYKIAIVKVEAGLIGADKLAEVKVGFIPPPKPDPNPRPPVGGPVIRRPAIVRPELKEGQKVILFLAKEPSGKFYVMPPMLPFVDMANANANQDLEAIKRVVAILADPKKGLKSDKAVERAETAAALILRYRSAPFGVETETTPLALEESQMLLKALAEGEWSGLIRPGSSGINLVQAFYALGLTVNDGWVAPVVAPSPPGAPPVDFNAIQKDAFVKWLAGPGQKYQIKKIVPKTGK